MSIVVYQDVATPIVPVEGIAGRIRETLGDSLRSMRYITTDFAGLYQDDKGATPVTAVGQPVGLMLDRRFGLARGPEIVTNGGFEADTAWNKGPGWTISGGKAHCVHSGAGHSGLIQVNILEIGKRYDVIYELEVLAGSIATRVGSTGFGPNRTASGTYREVMECTGNTNFQLLAASGFSGNVDNVSVRELPGNHASQTTTTARPTLRSGPLRIDYDGVDDYLRTVFPALGSDVTIARSIPGVGAQILTGQTIAAGNWDDNVDSCAVLVIDRALTPSEQTLVTAFLNQQAGV